MTSNRYYEGYSGFIVVLAFVIGCLIGGNERRALNKKLGDCVSPATTQVLEAPPSYPH